MLTEQIKETIESALPGATAVVSDPMQDNTHLEAVVISADFEGMSLVKQHQMVMQALKGHFDTVLHALKLKTVTPATWEAENK